MTSAEWYTPTGIIEAARAALGSIDTDPASCKAAQAVVRAGTYYTEQDDGLLHEWRGNVWLNPPYGRGLVDKFVDKYCREIAAEHCTQAIVLVNASTETAWFHRLLGVSSALCILKGRLRNWRTTESHDRPRFAQILCYHGTNKRGFARAFERFGCCVEAVKTK